MRTKSLLTVGGPLPSGMQFSNLWSLIIAICGDAIANPPRPASGHDYEKAMPWLHRPFACEGLGDLVTLEKAKLRDHIRGTDKAW
jgi:hypothetical protein